MKVYLFQLHECDASHRHCLVRAENPEQASQLARQSYSRHHEGDIEFVETDSLQEGTPAVVWDSWHKLDVGDYVWKNE